jgi:uncharacterized protein (UPF0332 family)
LAPVSGGVAPGYYIVPLRGETSACLKWLDAFGKVFVETGRIELGLFDDLREAYGLRKLADYSTREEDRIPPDVAESMFLKAAYFVAMAEEFLKGAGGELEVGQNT